MKSAYLKKALEIISARKNTAESQIADKLFSLRQNEEFNRAESKLAILNFEKGRLVAQSLDLGNINSEIEEVEKEFLTVLDKLGLKKKDLELDYFCNRCNDTGYNNNKVCICLKKEINKLIAGENDGRICNISDFSKIDFTIFGAYEKEMRGNYFLIKEHMKAYPEIKKNILVLCGGAGTGKTYLASVFANALTSRLYDVLFMTSVKLNKAFLAYHLAPLEEKESIISPIFNAEVLIIDDLGRENKFNNVTIDYLYQLICFRQNKITLFTTNLSPENIKKVYEQQIFSRLADKKKSIWIQFKGDDLRLK